MSVTLPDELLQVAQMTESELIKEIAIMLFQQERITLGKAAQLSGIVESPLTKVGRQAVLGLHHQTSSMHLHLGDATDQ